MTAKLALGMCTMMLKKVSGHRVDNYDIIFIPEQKELYFMVFCPKDQKLPPEYNQETRTRRYNAPDAIQPIIDSVKSKYGKNLTEGDKLVLLKVIYADKGASAKAEIYYTDKYNIKHSTAYKII